MRPFTSTEIWIKLKTDAATITSFALLIVAGAVSVAGVAHFCIYDNAFSNWKIFERSIMSKWFLARMCVAFRGFWRIKRRGTLTWVRVCHHMSSSRQIIQITIVIPEWRFISSVLQFTVNLLTHCFTYTLILTNWFFSFEFHLCCCFFICSWMSNVWCIVWCIGYSVGYSITFNIYHSITIVRNSSKIGLSIDKMTA